MDTKRLPLKQQPQRADEAWALYQKLDPALVILGDDAAMNICRRALQRWKRLLSI